MGDEERVGGSGKRARSGYHLAILPQLTSNLLLQFLLLPLLPVFEIVSNGLTMCLRAAHASNGGTSHTT